MARLRIEWNEDGEVFRTVVRTFRLWEKDGVGFYFYPKEGNRLKCAITADKRIVSGGITIGRVEYRKTGPTVGRIVVLNANWENVK